MENISNCFSLNFPTNFNFQVHPRRKIFVLSQFNKFGEKRRGSERMEEENNSTEFHSNFYYLAMFVHSFLAASSVLLSFMITLNELPSQHKQKKKQGILLNFHWGSLRNFKKSFLGRPALMDCKRLRAPRSLCVVNSTCWKHKERRPGEMFLCFSVLLAASTELKDKEKLF